MLTWLTLIYLSIWAIVPNTYFKCGDIGWYYNIAIQTAYICNVWDTEFTKHHESAHHIWYQYLTDTERKAYENLYNKVKKNPKAFLRDYSRKSVEEDFADMYAMHIMNWTPNIHMKKRISFIKKLWY